MTTLRRVRWIDLPSTVDPRGTLTAVEAEADVPFEIRRVFFMHHIVAERGGHAHRDTDQLIIAAAGSFQVIVFDGRESADFVLDSPTRGLYVPRMLLIELTRFSAGAVCLVLASTHYDMSRSIRSREEYLQALSETVPDIST